MKVQPVYIEKHFLRCNQKSALLLCVFEIIYKQNLLLLGYVKEGKSSILFSNCASHKQ